MIKSHRSVVREVRGNQKIVTHVHHTPEVHEEQRVTTAPGMVVVETATSAAGFLVLTKEIETPLEVVKITHTEEDTATGRRVTDEKTVESTPLADMLEMMMGGAVVVDLSAPRLRVYPPAPEQEDLYGLEDLGDHGEPDEEDWWMPEEREEIDCGEESPLVGCSEAGCSACQHLRN